MSHCAEVAAGAKKAPGANFSGVVTGPVREQAGMDAIVLPSPAKPYTVNVSLTFIAFLSFIYLFV